MFVPDVVHVNIADFLGKEFKNVVFAESSRRLKANAIIESVPCFVGIERRRIDAMKHGAMVEAKIRPSRAPSDKCNFMFAESKFIYAAKRNLYQK